MLHLEKYVLYMNYIPSLACMFLLFILKFDATNSRSMSSNAHNDNLDFFSVFKILAFNTEPCSQNISLSQFFM